MKKKKIVAILTILVMIFNMFSPYTTLFVHAATGALEDDSLLFYNMGVTSTSKGNVLQLQIGISTEELIDGIDLQFEFDPNVIALCNPSTGAVGTTAMVLNKAMVKDGLAPSTLIFSSDYSVTDENMGRINLISTFNGTFDPISEGYQYPSGDDDFDKPASVNPDRGYIPLLNCYFLIKDTSIDTSAIPSSLFKLTANGLSLPTGCKIAFKWSDGSTNTSKDLSNITFGNFATSSDKTVTGIEVEKEPTNTTYEHGDTIDLTGGIIKVTYDDGSTEQVDMTDSGVSITTPLNGKADVDNPTVTISYEGKTANFDITVTDPVQSLTVTSPMTTVEYNHADNLDFSGLKLTATKKSGDTVVLTQSSTGVTTSEIVADVTSSAFTQTSATGVTPIKGTQEITFTYEGQTAKQTVIVNDTISSVEVISQPTKIIYKRGESLDLSGAKVKVTLGSGGSTEISLPDGSVTVGTYSKTTTGVKQNLSVALGTVTSADTINVEVYNYITSSTLTAPTDVNPEYNTELDLTGGKFKLYWQDGTISFVELTSSDVIVTGYNKQVLTEQTVTATYNTSYTLSDGTQIPETITKTFNVQVTNPITSIVITAPTKNKYNHGESIQLSGGTITITYADGTTGTEAITSATITEADGSTVNMSPKATEYASDYTLSKTLKIEYTKDGVTGTANYPITIINDIQSIKVYTTPTKVAYNVKDTLDVTGGEIEITRATGTPEVIPMTSSMVTNFDSSVENTALKLNVEYTENGITKTTDYTVSVKDSVKSIALKTTPKQDYKYNEDLDVSAGVITVESGSGTKEIPVTESMVTGYDKTKLGDQELTITYGGQTVKYTVNVKDYVTGISVNPTSITGTYKEELSTLINNNSITYTITYAKEGAKSPVALEESMVTGYNKTTTSAQSLTVTYTDKDADSYTNGQDFTATLDVTLANVVTGITITAPSTTTYNHAESLNLTGGVINLTYADGTTGTEAITSATITEADGSTVNMSPKATEYASDYTLSKTLKIEYTKDGVTGIANYPITIINDIQSIKVYTTPTKVAYNVKDTLDVTGGEIEITRATGTPEVIPMTSSMVTNFDSSVENTALKLNVEYTENGITKTTDYTVSVKDSVKSIALKTTPKQDYKYNEDLDVSAGVITVESGSGTKEIPVTESMVTGYDKTKLGDQELTITYGGQTVKYTVNVKDYVTGISVNPTSITGTYKEELSTLINNNSITYTITYAKEGAKSPVALEESMVTGYNKTTTSAQSLTVTYTDKDADSYTNGQDFTATLDVTLANVVTGITITAPSTTTYNHAESLNLTGGVINLTYADGTTGTEAITSATITEADGSTVNMSPKATEYASDYTLSKTLKIEYTKDGVTGTANYPITIINDIQSIKVYTTPTKVAYNVKDTLDVTGGEIEITRATGTPEVIPMTSSMVTNFDSSVENTALKLNVEYTENGITKTTDYTVSVKDSVKSIALKTTPKQDYKYNEDLDVSAGVITVESGSGTKEIPVTESMVTGYDKTKLGDQELTITYGGQTVKYTVNVKDYVTGISVNPTSITGTYKEELSTLINNNSITYTITYAKEGAKSPVALEESMVTGYNKTTTSAQSLTVTYTDKDADSYTNGQDFTATLDVTLANVVTGITITAPSTTTYNHAESLNLTGGVINLTYADGTTGTEAITSATITEADGSTVNMSPKATEYASDYTLSKTLKIEYTKDGVTGTANYPITIINDIQSIKVYTTPTKVAYNVKDTLDVTGGEIEITRATGTPEVIPMTSSMVTNFDSSVENTALKLNVEYTENGITKTTDYTVSVKDSVKSIALKTTPKQDYKYNEDLDVSAGVITVESGSGTKEIPVTESMVTGYDKTKLGDQELTITYGGQTVKYTVNVKDYVTGISVNPTSITGTYKEELSTLINNNSITYTITYAKEGAKSPVALEESMVTGYNKTTTSAQSLTVTYTDKDADSYTNGQDFTATLDVTLANVVTGITITAPSRTTYNHAESLKLTGGVINLTYADGTTGTEAITSATITEADGSAVNMSPSADKYASDYTLSKTLKIEYTKDGVTGTANYPITIINDIQSIKVYTTPTKVAYNVKDTLDVTGGEIEITRATGTPEVIPMTSSMVTNFDSSVENTALKLNVEYTENGITKTTDYTVSVKDSVKSIALKTTPKQDYKYNEDLDVSAGVITVESGSGTKEIPVTESMVTGYDKTKLGDQELTITYGGQTVKYTVNVKDYVTGISVNPTSITGTYKEELSTLINNNSITYTITYAKEGAKSPVALEESMVTGYNKTTTSAQSLTVTYTDKDADSYTNGQNFTTTLNVTLIDEVTGISIKTQPKTDYKYDEPLDVSTGVITVLRPSGPEDIQVTPDMVTGYDKTKLGDQELTITYGGQTTTYKVNVKDYVIGIKLTPPIKVKYEYGESLDLAGGSVQKVMASGAATSPVVLTDSSVTLSTFNPNLEGTQTIDVTYEGKTESFGVIVEDNIQTISMKNLPQTEYQYGDNIEVTGGKILVTRSSGKTEVVDITTSMITGYNPNKVGAQTITVTYKDKTTTYEVNVKDYIKDINIVKPNKLVYKIDEIIDLAGGTISTIMASGTVTSPIAMTNAEVQIQGFDTSSEGAKLIKVSYKGFTKTFGITVVDELSNMVIKTLPDKLDYRYGESLDVTGGTIEIIKESGASQIINMSKDMVSGYTPKKLGNQTLTVTYEGFTQQFIVNVEDYISKLEVKAPEKVEYEYGESLDLTGAEVSIIMASGKVEGTAEMTASMISGYDKTKEGKQTIKVEYKDLQGSFQVNVIDKVKGISLNSEPNKINYKYGESLDLTGTTVNVIKSSGIYTIPVTNDMVSGYDPQDSGIQVVTITYKGFTTKFMVSVAEQEIVIEPEAVKPTNKPITNTTTKVETEEQKQITEQITEQLPEENTDIPTKEEIVEEPKQEEKPTETLGVKDEKEEPVQNDKEIAGIMSIAGLLLLLILILFRRNVKVYVEEDGEFVLGGVDKITKKNPKLDIDQYLDGETYPNRVKLRLSDSISEKLDGKEIEIKHRGQVIKHKVHYNDEPYEFILE